MPYVITSDDRDGTATVHAQVAEEALKIADGWAELRRTHIVIETPDGDILPLRRFRMLLGSAGLKSPA